MGTTRIKVIDLSSEQKEIKTSRKHARLASLASIQSRSGLAKRAEKLSGLAKIKGAKESREPKEQKPATTDNTETAEITESPIASVPSVSPPVHSVVAKKSTSGRHSGKKYQLAKSQIDPQKTYPAKEAIELLHKMSFTKFDPTVEIHLNVSEKNIKGNVNLPHPFGKRREKTYLIFTSKKPATTDNTEKEHDNTEKKSVHSSKSKVPSVVAKKNIIWGNAKTIDEIQSGSLRPNRDFDTVLSEPKFMPQLVKIAKILGPAGMMPNPKDKTIVEDPLESVQKQTSDKGAYEFKTEPTAPIIHSTLGKLSEKPDYLEENLKSIISAIGPTKIKKAIIKSTMSPSVKIDIASVTS